MARPKDLVDVSESGYIASEGTRTASNRPSDLIDIDPDYVSQQINPYNTVTGVATGAAVLAPAIEKKILGTDPRAGRSLETYLRTQRHHEYPGLDLKGLQTEWQKIAGPNARIVTMQDVQEALKATRPVDLSTYKTAPKPTTAAGKAVQPVKKLGEAVEQLNPFLGQGYGSRVFRGAGRAGLGFGAAYEGAQAYNKALEGDVAGAAGSASTSAGLGLMAVPHPVAKGAGAILAGVPLASNLIGNAQAAPMTKEEASGTAFDIGTSLLGPIGMALTPSQLGHGTLRKRNEVSRPGVSVLEGSRLPPEERAQGGLVHLADGGQPQFGEARAYEPSYSEKIRDYAAKHIGREQANRLFAGPNARPEDNFNPISLALQTPGAIADSAAGFVKAGQEGDYLGGMGHYLVGALNVAPFTKPVGKLAKKIMPGMAGGGEVIKAVGKNLIKVPSQVFKAAPEQTVTDPLRNAFPGIYKRPDVIAAEAAARVAPEGDAMKRLFGVTRDDLYEMGKGRVGNQAGLLPGAAANPKGSKAAMAVMNPRNEQRLLDVLGEAEKHPALVRGMDPWYIMDPAYKRLEELVGPEEAIKKYRQLNTLTGMASPGSDVLTEMNRGTAANFLATQGRFNDFINYGGKQGKPGTPPDMSSVLGHPYHPTAQAFPMKQYLDTGKIQMSSPKVPAYIQASGVPQTGFQTDLPVGDAHWSRAVGLADTRGAATRKGQSVIPGASVSNPEMSTLAPWWKDKIAGQVGLESVPAQARAWGAFSPQTGVESPIGAPKLELLSMKIMEAANRYGVSPEQARDMILKGEGYAGKKEGGPIDSYAPGGKVLSAIKKLSEEAQAAYKAKFTPGFYHGSPSNEITAFDSLKSSKGPENVTPGVTFAARNPNFANSLLPDTFDEVTNTMVHPFNPGSTVYPLSINMSNHFDPKTKEGQAVLADFVKQTYLSGENVDKKAAAKFLSNITDPHSNWTTMEGTDFLNHLRNTGHKSFEVREGGFKNVGVFNPADIRGKFAKFNPEDAADPDFMKAEGGPVQHFQAGKRVLQSGLDQIAKLARHPHGQDPKVAQALEEYLKGNISQEERIRIANQFLPIRQWNELPPNYTDEQIRNALTSDKQAKALAPVPTGMRVGNRLDIPAYTQKGVYVDTTHDTANKPISYGRTGHLKDVAFSSSPDTFVRVGLGTKEQALTPLGAQMGTAKTPKALIKGIHQGTPDDEVRRMMAEMMKDPRYTQIGMDPRKHSQFYDKSTGMPVFSAEEKLQSGPLILAPKKGLETTSWDDPRLNLSDFPGKKYAPGGKVVGGLAELAKKLMPFAEREANKAKFLESSAVKHPVYHGTGSDIRAFDTHANELRGTKTELDLLSPLGSHFAKDPAMANNFTRNIENAAVYKTNLQLKNPKVYNSEMDLRDDILSQGSNHSEVDRMFENPENYGLSSLDEMAIKYDSDPAFRRIVNRDALHESEDLVQETGESVMHQDFLKQLTDSWKKANPEIDGVIYRNEAPKELRGVTDPTAYIAFEPTQIKSAIGNTGTYNPLDPDITKKKGGKVKKK